MERDIITRLLRLERRLDNLSLHERGWAPTFLTTHLTNTDFDGDSFSDVGANTKIENTSWSTTVPANAKAMLIYGIVRDSDSANTSGLYFALYPAAASTVPALNWTPSGMANDDWHAECGVVPCTDGDIWYRCNASGASTLDVFLYVWGYWT